MILRSSVLCCVALAMVSCGKGGSADAPSGQVVATIDGQEITASQLRLEMGEPPSDPAAAAAAQQAALETIVNRKLLVGAAKDRELDNSPLAAMVKERAGDMALVQLLQMNLASAVPKISDNEISEFVSAHPATFSQRKLITVDQMIVPEIQPALVRQMEQLKTMADIKALLDRNNVRYLQSGQVLDTLNINPESGARITALGLDAVFISPSGKGVAISRIAGGKPAPLTGDEAQRAAQLVLAQQRSGTQVRKAMEQIVKRGQSKVKINPQYQAKAAQSGTEAPAMGGEAR